MIRETKDWAPSQLSKRITMQCMLTVVIYLLVLFGAYFLAYMVCAQFVWQESDPLYYFLKLLQTLSPVLIVLAILIGMFFIMRHYFTKPLRYLDQVVAAAKQLTMSPDKPISLSRAMSDTQNELNLVREKAINSSRAAREAEQRKNDLVVYLAHDLKTPLTSVIGYLSLLRDEPELSPERRARYTGIALEKAERLEELINEFFDITRFNLSHIELNIQTVDLSRMLEQIAFEFKPLLESKELRWETDIEPGVVLSCDPDKLERVFDNLLRNAVNYSYRGGEIRLCLKKCGGEALVFVKNRGKTIPPEKLRRIFEQFFRMDSSRGSNTGGAGLGLAIAKEIVELHGGSIEAESSAETVLFNVSLPLGTKGK